MIPEWQTNTGKISKPCRFLIGVFNYYISSLLCNLLPLLNVCIHFNRLSSKFSYRTLKSRPTPLAWLINKAMVAKQGQSWPSNKCQAWYAKDMMDKSWLQSLPACPCNLHQALVDFGRWQKDPDCHLDSRTPDNCAFHFTAVHCVRSVRPNK